MTQILNDPLAHDHKKTKPYVLTVFQGEANGVYVSQSVIKYVKYDG
jgi:hypothetical protein